MRTGDGCGNYLDMGRKCGTGRKWMMGRNGGFFSAPFLLFRLREGHEGREECGKEVMGAEINTEIREWK